MANHGPMVIEVLARRGRAGDITSWLDAYLPRLGDAPTASERITDDVWRQALGARVGDWTVYLSHQMQDQPWRDVLATWWPRLLPGVAAGATHGVIRTGHAVRTLLSGDETGPAAAELAHSLAYWAARFQPVPGVAAPGGHLEPATALESIPAITDQDGPIRIRLGRLAELAEWPDAAAALRPANDPEDARRRLTALVDAATVRYLYHGSSSPVLLVHTATAPSAVLHTLPALPPELWLPSLAAAWAASAAITAMYASSCAGPASHSPPESADRAADLLDRAVADGDEHAIKFTDTAIDVYGRTGDERALSAAMKAIELLSN
jgi:hypothetical protein